MHITDEAIKQLCIRKGNKNPSNEDIKAFRKLMIAADCTDAETVEEADIKISMTMSLICASLNPYEEHMNFYLSLEALRDV